jgi:selenocysteine lyase/cysteine desulfurase
MASIVELFGLSSDCGKSFCFYLETSKRSPNDWNFCMNEAENSAKSSLRRCMPVCQSYAYFDHAAVGPIPQLAADAIQKWTQQALLHGDVHWPEWAKSASELRSASAELLNCTTQEIALIANTTFGINVVANGYRWNSQPGSRDSVVVLENEFSSNLLPWIALERRGVEVRRVPVPESGVVDINSIRQMIDHTTRIVSVSWVGYFSGYRIDLAKLCDLVHSAGAMLFVDAIQGLGVFSLDSQKIPIDFLAADGHKWMLGPEGAGLLYIREGNLEVLEPTMQGWGSIRMAHHFNTNEMTLKSDASRYEGGSANHAGQIGLGKSLRMLLDHGCHKTNNPVAMAVLENAAIIEEGLRSLGASVFRARQFENHSDDLTGIITFVLDGVESSQVRNRLLDEGIVLSVRHGRLRVATHAYNDQNDIERLLKGVRDCTLI